MTSWMDDSVDGPFDYITYWCNVWPPDLYEVGSTIRPFAGPRTFVEDVSRNFCNCNCQRDIRLGL